MLTCCVSIIWNSKGKTYLFILTADGLFLQSNNFKFFTTRVARYKILQQRVFYKNFISIHPILENSFQNRQVSSLIYLKSPFLKLETMFLNWTLGYYVYHTISGRFMGGFFLLLVAERVNQLLWEPRLNRPESVGSLRGFFAKCYLIFYFPDNYAKIVYIFLNSLNK